MSKYIENNAGKYPYDLGELYGLVFPKYNEIQLNSKTQNS